MKRLLSSYLSAWLKTKDRKPLVLRGARQVGKTWLVKHLAETAGKRLIEINFEKRPDLVGFFESNDPRQILLNLSSDFNEKIEPENCILFLDEIQVAPSLFAKLRWFAEDMPQLPVIATGSLLDFVLANHTFSMPVGRITYAYLEPLSFEEFLLANDKRGLVDYLAAYKLDTQMPSAIHDQLMIWFREYLLVGGMPAVVQNWVAERSLSRVSQIQNDLLVTYRDDFSKYKNRIAIERMDEVMMAIPTMLGKKFVYSHVSADLQTAAIKQVLNALEKARVAHRVKGCSANGVPLAAEIKEKYFKMIFLDVGLCSTALGLNLTQINAADEITMINNGGIAEQIVGQLLRTIDQPYIEPALYCWHRDEPGSSAEVDYIIQHGSSVIPVEVKAGTTGTLKSLHLFMGLKKKQLAVRINSDISSMTEVNVKDTMGKEVQYRLLSIPFYLLGQLPRLISSAAP